MTEAEREAEREAAARGQSVMQGLLGMTGGQTSSSSTTSGVPTRPDSRASTHDGDGLPPRKKQAVDPSSGSRTPSSPTLGSRSGSAALPGRMQSGLRVSTPQASDDDEMGSMRGSTPPVGFGSSAGPQRVSLSRNPGSNGAQGQGSSFVAAVSTPNRQRFPGTGFSTGMTTNDVLNPDRLRHMFNKVPIEVIEDTIIQYGDEPPVQVLKRLRAAQDGVPYRAPGVASVKTIKPVATRAPVPLHHSSASGNGEPSFSSPGQPTPTQVRKNPKMVSAIYANRSERKPTQAAIDVDASSPGRSDVGKVQQEAQQEEPTIVSDDEAVTDVDSDVGAGRKGKGKMQVDKDGQDMDEVKALEVFNTCTAETLTGTIGEVEVPSVTGFAR